jgi:uncharacterized lipoprotein YmbA
VKSRAIVALFTILVVSATGWGQQKPDFSGTWKLNVDQSDYGDLQGPKSRTDTIEQHDDEITETVAAVQRHKDQSYVLHFNTDGRKTVFPPGTEIHIPPVTVQGISASWQGNTLVVIEWLKFDDNDLPARYVYTLSADRSKLSMTLFLGEAKPAATFVFERVRE